VFFIIKGRVKLSYDIFKRVKDVSKFITITVYCEGSYVGDIEMLTCVRMLTLEREVRTECLCYFRDPVRLARN